MEPDKEIIVNGQHVWWATSVKASPELSTSSTNTFDGAVTQGLADVGWTLEFEKIRYEPSATHQAMSETIEGMFAQPGIITIRETIRPSYGEDPYTIVDTYFGCITDGYDYEIKPDEHTIESLKFKVAKRTRKWE